MEHDELFLQTLRELEERIEAASDYAAVMTAALLRKLLTDARPLVHVVNEPEGRRHKLRFSVGGEPADLDEDTVVWVAGAGVYPDHASPAMPVHTDLTLDQMLASTVMVVQGVEISIHQLVDHMAHVRGGVHVGEPKTDAERASKLLDQELALVGVRGGGATIYGIARVVLRGLEPLREQIRSRG